MTDGQTRKLMTIGTWYRMMRDDAASDGQALMMH